MNAILKTFTAMSALLALSTEAGANMNNISPSLPRLNLVNPGIVRPITGLRTSRPAMGLRIDAKGSTRKGKATKRQETGQRSQKDRTRAAKSNAADVISARKAAPASHRQMIASSRANKFPLPEHPPLPARKPQNARLSEAGPQPEPPTLKFEAIAHLRLFEEVGQQGKLRDRLKRNTAIDNAALGGNGGNDRSSFDWKTMVPDGNTQEQRPQNDQLWKAGLPAVSAYNPGVDQGGGFTPPWQRGQSKGRDHPGFDMTPGKAGGGLKGQRGWNNQDGETRHGRIIRDTRRGDTVIPRPSADGEDHGEVVRTTDRVLDNGRLQVTTALYEDGTLETLQTVWGNGDMKNTWITHYTDGTVRTETSSTADSEGSVRYTVPNNGPDSQPAPDQPVHAGPMPCPATSSACGPNDGPMSNNPSQWDKVAQPGKGDEQNGDTDFRASIAERRDVVTNPVDPMNHQPRGGGTGPRPIQHVTQPGGAGPDDPRG